jgi:N-acetyl-anhydromuramyl-L-alanine amidase AmpD
VTNRPRSRTSWISYGTCITALLAVTGYGPAAAAAPPAPRGGSALQSDFTAAAAEFHVPVGVLMAVSYRETRWESHQGRPSTTGNYNVMGLTQVTAADVAPPSDAELLAGMDLSGDPAVSARFDASRALRAVRAAGRAAGIDTSDPRLHTLDAAAALIGAAPAEVRDQPRQSVRAGAALLASYEKAAVGALPADPGRWWAAVARYSQSPDPAGARQFARRVFDTLRGGASRTTADGAAVALTGDPSVRPAEPAAPPPAAGAAAAECPATLACAFVPAAYAKAGSAPDDFGNYNVSDRPANGEDVRYIVVHDMEGTFQGSIDEFQDPAAQASAHYLVADDGRVTQMVQLKDEAWHSANKTVNMHSVGVEHEGYAIRTGDWFTEQEYDSSATLVKFLAQKFGIPLDREHVIGHDEVPGVLDAKVAAQHWDPGPYWDWNHYMALLGAPDDTDGTNGAGSADGTAGAPAVGQLVRVVPPYTTANQPEVTNGGASVPAHPANFLYLRTSPSPTAAPATDPYLGNVAWTEGSDWADKVAAGGSYVVADVSGDWTAIWYGGQKLWFDNPGGAYTRVLPATQVVTPKSGTIAVYGRAYPEDSAYPADVPVQPDNTAALTKYRIPAGQAYAQAGPEKPGDYWYAGSFAGTAAGDRTLVTGTAGFYPIRYNHRIAWVRASDVRLAATAAPAAGARDRVPAVVGAAVDAARWISGLLL